MAFKTPTNSVLTETQSELTSKIGAMKSLLGLPFLKRFNIPKGKQISTYDFLMKILRAIGVNPEIVLQTFIDKVFGLTNTFLEDVVIKGVASALDAKNVKLSTDKSNEEVLKDSIPADFLVTVKLVIAKELTLMIFGPQNGKASETLVPNPIRRSQLLGEAVCGYNMFTLSNNPSIKNEDIEFNRVKLKQQLDAGQIIFEINCQDVKVELPEDPGYFFGNGSADGTIKSRPVTPAQSLNLLIQYVANRGGQINNEQNSKQIGKSFFEILIEKLMSYVTTLIMPYCGPIFSFLRASSNPGASSSTPENIMYGSCAINSGEDESKAFATSVINDLLQELIKMLLMFALDKFKDLVLAYFLRTANEQARRRLSKIKLKFKIFFDIPDFSKIEKIAKAMSILDKILK